MDDLSPEVLALLVKRETSKALRRQISLMLEEVLANGFTRTFYTRRRLLESSIERIIEGKTVKLPKFTNYDGKTVRITPKKGST